MRGTSGGDGFARCPMTWWRPMSIGSLMGARDFSRRRCLMADPRVVAYALIGLEMTNGQILENLPASLLTRTELIETVHGCFVMEKSLGGFALSKQEDAAEMKSGEVCEDAGGDT